MAVRAALKRSSTPRTCGADEPPPSWNPRPSACCWVRWVPQAPDRDEAGDDADPLGGGRAAAGNRGRRSGWAGRGLAGLVCLAGRRRRPVLLVPVPGGDLHRAQGAPAARRRLLGRLPHGRGPPAQGLPGQGRGAHARAPGPGGRRAGRARRRRRRDRGRHSDRSWRVARPDRPGRRRPSPAGDQAVRAPAPPRPGPAAPVARPPRRRPRRGPVLAALGAGRRRQDQPAGRLARPAGPPGRLAHPRRARPGRPTRSCATWSPPCRRSPPPAGGGRWPGSTPRSRRRPRSWSPAWSTTWPPCPRPACWSWTTTTSCAPRPSTPRSPSCSTTCHRPCTW